MSIVAFFSYETAVMTSGQCKLLRQLTELTLDFLGSSFKTVICVSMQITTVTISSSYEHLLRFKAMQKSMKI